MTLAVDQCTVNLTCIFRASPAKCCVRLTLPIGDGRPEFLVGMGRPVKESRIWS